MGEVYAESLLQKNAYFEGCPGCKVDQHKELQRGVPIKQVFIIWIIVLSTGNAIKFFCTRVCGGF